MKILNRLNFTHLVWIFTALQVITIITYLAHRGETFVSFDFFLQNVKYSTLFLLFVSILLVFKHRNKILEFEIVKYLFILQVLILYFVMIINTDQKAINSPTILLMLIATALVFVNPVSLRDINLLAIVFAFINIFVVLLQVLKVIPVAQDNIRDGIGLILDRPTGLLFNAFAMSYAGVLTFLICLYFLKNKKLRILNILGLVMSFVSIILSATRTPLILIVLFGIIILIQDLKFVNKNWKIISFITSGIIVAFPIFTLVIGNFTNNVGMSTLNGRTFLWSCVTSKWQEFIPFGVGVQAAFPNGFCSDDEWFSKLRHPENMFLLTFVESGILGVAALVALFVVTLWKSGLSLKNGSALPLALTGTFLMSSIFYVPMFHYLPFLEGRTANRGVFNFFLLTVLWMSVMANFSQETKKQLARK
jgi:O-antigen ligase